MKKKILNVVLGIVLVLAIASFVFVIYVKFFYNIDDTDKDTKKDNQVSETFSAKDLQIITQKIVNSNITKHYFEGKIVTSTNTENAITIMIDKNKIEIPYKNNTFTLKSDASFDKKQTIYVLQIFVDALGRKNGYKEGEFINTVNNIFANKKVDGITYKEENENVEIIINVKNKLEPQRNDREIELSKTYEIIYTPWTLINVSKENYAVLNENSIIYDVKLEHNSVYNILKVSFKNEFLGINDEAKDSYKITTRLYDKTDTLISESYKDYSLDETNINNIKISHMLKNKDDYTNIKYISFEVE